MAHTRQLKKQFTSTHTTKFENLLVSGCSYTYNNSDTRLVTWPYYLRDIAGFNKVYDASQSGAGSNHVFNSIINEIETDPDINADNTLVIIMWSGLLRTDVIAETYITKPHHTMSNYEFNDKFSTLSISVDDGDTLVEQLCHQYKKLVSSDAQILESSFKIIALQAYLEKRGFKYIMLNWMDQTQELDTLNTSIKESVLSIFDPVRTLDEYTQATQQRIPNDGHPTPDAHLSWTLEYLIPYLESKNLITADQ